MYNAETFHKIIQNLFHKKGDDVKYHRLLSISNELLDQVDTPVNEFGQLSPCEQALR